MKSCCKNTLGDIQPVFDTRHTAVTVVLASGGYPSSFEKGKAINGLNDAEVGCIL